MSTPMEENVESESVETTDAVLDVLGSSATPEAQAEKENFSEISYGSVNASDNVSNTVGNVGFINNNSKEGNESTTTDAANTEEKDITSSDDATNPVKSVTVEEMDKDADVAGEIKPQSLDSVDPQELLAEGIEFDSFEAFKTTLDQYSEATGANFARSDSLSVERAVSISKPKHKTYNPEIQYTHVNFTCMYGGKKVRSRSSGIRNASSRKCGCPVRLRLSVTSDGQRLVVKESKLNPHNHNLDEDKMRLRNLDEETETEIYNLICLHENKRLARVMIRDKLTKETGKEIKMKDICNIEKRVAKKMQRLNETGGGEEKENNSDMEDNSNSEDEDNNEDDDDDAMDEVTDEDRIEEKISEKKILESSPARPRRHVKEPSRFRDFYHDTENKPTSPIESDTKEKTQSTKERTPDMKEKAPRGPGRPRLHKNEPRATSTPNPGSSSGRGRKRKVPLDRAQDGSKVKVKEPHLSLKEDSSKSSHVKNELKERKIAVLEELLSLEKKKMKMMEEMMGKLDRILENQEKDKNSVQNS